MHIMPVNSTQFDINKHRELEAKRLLRANNFWHLPIIPFNLQPTFQDEHSYPIEESPHRLRRHYESPSEFDSTTNTYPIPNGHLVRSTATAYTNSNYHPYDEYMHANSSTNDLQYFVEDGGQRRYDILDEEDEEPVNQDGIVYSEDG